MVKYEREMGNGITNPLLMKTTDGPYVVKYLGNEHGTRILINEYICYKLAKLMEIPIPDAALITIDEETLKREDSLVKLGVQSGVHFGSKLVQRAEPSIQLPLLRLVKNKEDIPSIILFDQFIYNDDRTRNKGNLLVDIKEKRLLAIDHSHTFKLGTLWDELELKKILDEELCLVKEFHAHNYKVLLKFVNGNNPFNKIIKTIQGIQKSDINLCFEGLPTQWELSKKDEDALKNFIWYRIENTPRFLTLLKEQCHDWKGGDEFEF